jgi:hypothetical protein
VKEQKSPIFALSLHQHHLKKFILVAFAQAFSFCLCEQQTAPIAV